MPDLQRPVHQRRLLDGPPALSGAETLTSHVARLGQLPPRAASREVIATLEAVSGRSLEVVERLAAAGDVRRTSADAKRIEDDLGWRATTSLEDGLRAQWEWASVRVAAP